jgi:hypothetical protein
VVTPLSAMKLAFPPNRCSTVRLAYRRRCGATMTFTAVSEPQVGTTSTPCLGGGRTRSGNLHLKTVTVVSSTASMLTPRRLKGAVVLRVYSGQKEPAAVLGSAEWRSTGGQCDATN